MLNLTLKVSRVEAAERFGDQDIIINPPLSIPLMCTRFPVLPSSMGAFQRPLVDNFFASLNEIIHRDFEIREGSHEPLCSLGNRASAYRWSASIDWRLEASHPQQRIERHWPHSGCTKRLYIEQQSREAVPFVLAP